MTPKNEKTSSLAHAKAHFAECVRRVEKGQSIVLTRHGRPVARLSPLALSERHADLSSDPGRWREANEVREGFADYEPRSTAPLSNTETRRAALQRLLEDEIWPQIPEEMIGKAPTKQEREEILGIGEESP